MTIEDVLDCPESAGYEMLEKSILACLLKVTSDSAQPDQYSPNPCEREGTRHVK